MRRRSSSPPSIGAASFREDRWERPGGGGGVSRVLSEGATFEKAGVNRSSVEGVLDPQLAQRIGARSSGVEPGFLSPGQPRGPSPEPDGPNRSSQRTLLRDSRPRRRAYRRLVRRRNRPHADLPVSGRRQPFSPNALATCATVTTRRSTPRFKLWCDHYFVNTHRGDERRGSGGIFSTTRAAGKAAFRSIGCGTSSSGSAVSCPRPYGAHRGPAPEPLLRREGTPVPAGPTRAVRRVQSGARPGILFCLQTVLKSRACFR